MRRCVIVGGADISNYDRINTIITSEDYVIFCDSGLKHMQKLAAMPSLIVGDFDSHENPQLDIETIVLPCEKDDTDTVFAVKEAIKRGFDDFLLIGVVGARLDHIKDEAFTISFDLIDVRFPGTGDIFSAVLISDVLNGETLEGATAHAMKTVREIIKDNLDKKEKFFGVDIERYISEGKL